MRLAIFGIQFTEINPPSPRLANPTFCEKNLPDFSTSP